MSSKKLNFLIGASNIIVKDYLQEKGISIKVKIDRQKLKKRKLNVKSTKVNT